MRIAAICLLLLPLNEAAARAADLKLDETQGDYEAWGYRPASSAVSETTPPSFCWRPQKGIVGLGAGVRPWRRTSRRSSIAPRGSSSTSTARREVFPPGAYTWRYRGVDTAGQPDQLEPGRARSRFPPARWPCRCRRAASCSAASPSRIRGCSSGRRTCRGCASWPKGPMQRPVSSSWWHSASGCWPIPPPTAEPPKYPPEHGPKAARSGARSGGATASTRSRALDGAATLGLHAPAGRQGGVRPTGQADPAGLRQVGPQGRHRLPLQRRGRHALHLATSRAPTRSSTIC